MLTSEHAIVTYERLRVFPDRLDQRRHARYFGHAEAMLCLYREGVRSTRHDLHAAVRRLLSEDPDCPLRRIEAFCKLLDDASEYDTDASGRAWTLRRRVFGLAAPRHPLVCRADRLFEHDEQAVKADIARELGLPWEEIARRLFADVTAFHRLKAFAGYPDAYALLSRYNVAQVQAVLYRATGMTIWAREDFKTILRYVKLARLLHRIAFLAPSQEYRIDLDGPASVLRQSRRYGVAMAKFLPALVACRNWRMRASIQTNRGGWKRQLELSAESGLKSHLPEPEEFDSSVEAALARKWGNGQREGWRLEREGTVLHRQQKVFVPDFTFRHEDGRIALLEIVGFWTPEYVSDKLAVLRAFMGQPILLAVAEGTGFPEAPDVIRFKTSLMLQDLLGRLRAVPPLQKT